MTTWEETTIRASARLSLLAAAVAAGLAIAAPTRQSAIRVLWTAGAILLLLHTLAAFHFQHGWRHQAAAEHIARRTHDLVGWNSSAGLYLNYLCLIWWLADALAWWLAPEWRRRRIGWLRAGWCFLAFMAVNAAIVFETGPTRWIGLVVVAILVRLWLRR